jgi:hypothetical protein
VAYAEYFRRRADEHQTEADTCRVPETRQGHLLLAEIYRSLAEHESRKLGNLAARPELITPVGLPPPPNSF